MNIILTNDKILCGEYYIGVASTDVDCNGVATANSGYPLWCLTFETEYYDDVLLVRHPPAHTFLETQLKDLSITSDGFSKVVFKIVCF